VKDANSSLSNGGEKVTFAATDLIPHPISFAYRAGLLGVFLGLLALPLIYFGLVASIAFGVWFHLTHNLALFEVAGLWGLVAYVIPCIVGPVLIWFMIRPFFIKGITIAPPREIKAVDEPIVFEFVERICDLVRAPRPTHVYVDLAANASASINGVRGLLRREINSQYFPERFREKEFFEIAEQIRSASEDARLAASVASLADLKIYQSVLATLRELAGETTANI